MTLAQDAQLSPQVVLDEMKKNGVTHVVWLPDGEFAANGGQILAQPRPVFVPLKVVPEVENVPIGQRRRWQTRTRERVLADLRAELGVG